MLGLLQEDFTELAAAVLHQCFRPLIGGVVTAHYGYRRRVSLADWLDRAIRVSSVRMRSEDTQGAAVRVYEKGPTQKRAEPFYRLE